MSDTGQRLTPERQARLWCAIHGYDFDAVNINTPGLLVIRNDDKPWVIVPDMATGDGMLALLEAMWAQGWRYSIVGWPQDKARRVGFAREGYIEWGRHSFDSLPEAVFEAAVVAMEP